MQEHGTPQIKNINPRQKKSSKYELIAFSNIQIFLRIEYSHLASHMFLGGIRAYTTSQKTFYTPQLSLHNSTILLISISETIPYN